MFSRAKENLERLIFNVWLLFNAKKVCQTLVAARIKPEYVNSSYFLNNETWTTIEYSNYGIHSGLIYIYAKTKHELYLTYILTKDQALDYKKHIAYQLLKGNIDV